MNFALLLFVLLAISGVLWGYDLVVARKQRAPGSKEPWWVEYGASFFPVILVVFVLRSFIVEPFKIPSGSMLPTLQIGDFILVDKNTYGIRLPVLNVKVIERGSPQRGDVIVFRYPEDPSLDYIKRVVAVPGDTVAYQDKQLTVNGQRIALAPLDDYLDTQRMIYLKQFRESLGPGGHRLLVDPRDPPIREDAGLFSVHRENCRYNHAGVICKVPEGHYFVLGDNRDNSRDSRYWGFVPDENIVGKAFFIWFNFSELGRIGGFD